jgi:hypothetical protein
MTPQEQALQLCQKMASAIFQKLKLTDQYTVAVRRHGEPVAMPWLEIAFHRTGKPVETHEYCVSLPEVHYMVKTREEANDLATYLYKCVGIMLGKLEPKK